MNTEQQYTAFQHFQDSRCVLHNSTNTVLENLFRKSRSSARSKRVVAELAHTECRTFKNLNHVIYLVNEYTLTFKMFRHDFAKL